MIRRTVHFSGHVQGVGFRYTARNLALGYAVAGYVRNLPDGRVQLVVEGEPAEVERFIEAVEEHMAGFIRDKAVDNTPANGEFGPPDKGRLTIRH